MNGRPPQRTRWAVVLVCVLVLVLLAVQVLLHGAITGMDQAVSLHFAQHRSPGVTQVMLWVSRLHMTVVVLAATALLAGWRMARGDRAAAQALAVVPFGMVLNVVLKDSIQRPRPHWNEPLVQLATWSFPSGHALASTVFYGMVCALVFARTGSRLWRGLALALALAMVPLVCFSRVYLGAHFPSDVVAGVAEGTACVLVFLGVLRR